jgi:chemotaxis signal transduction protein
MKNHPRNEPQPVLTFRLGEQSYAVGIEDVVEVASMVELTTMPNSPAFMMGYANRHGGMLPVFDLRQIFEQEAAPVDSYTLFIVAAHDGHMAGLVVDEVHQVEYMEIGEYHTAAGKYIRDIVSHKGHLVQLISLPHLLGEVLIEDR